ncbi:MAG: succinate dehydrogenase [Alphaproteobacteria bacterium]|nr:MAG: succinate dehydrogenase [Alphaproteobacteria bacterium]
MRPLQRGNPLWWAFVVHRLSGVALALFLPLHFLVLGTAVRGAAALDGALAWTASGWVKAAELGLVVLLAVHLLGGLRLLAVEFLPWRNGQAGLAAAAGAVSLVIGFVFLVNAL